MDPELIELILSVGFFLFMLVLAFSTGTLVERAHYRSIRRREQEMQDLMILQTKYPPKSADGCKSEFVSGSVVIGMDYFKHFLANLRNLVGGNVGSYETLLDRARREAMLRLKEKAKGLNAQYVMNVKFSTANVMSSKGKQSGCVEVIVYGTAIIPR